MQSEQGAKICPLCGAKLHLRHNILYCIEHPEIRYCPHDGQKCGHECEGDECWRELDGS